MEGAACQRLNFDKYRIRIKLQKNCRTQTFNRSSSRKAKIQNEKAPPAPTNWQIPPREIPQQKIIAEGNGILPPLTFLELHHGHQKWNTVEKTKILKIVDLDWEGGEKAEVPTKSVSALEIIIDTIFRKVQYLF